MTPPENLIVSARRGATWRGLLVILAIAALSVNVVTRYSGAGWELSSIKTASSVKSSTQQTQRQRLLSNGLHWLSPAAATTLFQPPPTPVLAVSAVFPAVHLDSESWLYNRPPPSS